MTEAEIHDVIVNGNRHAASLKARMLKQLRNGLSEKK